MTINFHNQANRNTYTTRIAHDSWIKKIQELCDVNNKKILDIGCGGGIYSRVLAEMGASTVTALDFSKQQLSAAKEYCRDYPNIHFQLGSALDTRLGDNQYDIILTRAVIHHIQDLHACFKEIQRLLKPTGICIIQDRTPEDCLLKGTSHHIRGYFFEKYPTLTEKETARRHSSQKVIHSLQEAGFAQIGEQKLWEVRKQYQNITELLSDIKKRTGRSILHELDDQQIQELISYIKDQLLTIHEPIIEKDRWTIWTAVKS